MQKKWNLIRMLVIAGFLCMVPLDVPAASKAKEPEHDFNKEKSVSISAEKSYAETEKYTWLKYKAAADGYLTVEVSDLGEGMHAKGYLALYDSTRTKLLSSSSIFYNTANREKSYWYKFTFGMLKGQEYNIRIRSENAVKLTRTFTKLKDPSGPSRIKAAKLKKNKSKKGFVPAGSFKADWYQVNLTKRQKLRLYYSARTNGCFKLTIYMGTKRLGVQKIRNTAGQKIILSLKSGTKRTGLNAGKYYLKVERENTMSSGYYKIKWN